MTIAIVDVETTGKFWRRDRVVEVGAILLSEDGRHLREYETLVNPERDLGPRSIHGISSDDILHAPTFQEIAGDLAKFLSSASAIAGHNVMFDRQFLAAEYERLGFVVPECPTVCTCRMLGGRKLEACCRDYGVEFDGDAHRAIADARATARLLTIIMEEGENILEVFSGSHFEWPRLVPLNTRCVTRRIAATRARSQPPFLNRMAARIGHDVEAAPENVLAYLALIDRVLEDRTIDEREEDALVEAASDWGLTLSQIDEAHGTYIRDLAVHALSDGILTAAEKEDLHRVARLLGRNLEEFDSILEAASEQLRKLNTEVSLSGFDELRNKSICFTGELQCRIGGELVSRQIAEAIAEQAGLQVACRVTKKLDLLVVADPNSQSGKAKKARQYGIRVLAEPVFWRMLGVSTD